MVLFWIRYFDNQNMEFYRISRIACFIKKNSYLKCTLGHVLNWLTRRVSSHVRTHRDKLIGRFNKHLTTWNAINILCKLLLLDPRDATVKWVHFISLANCRHTFVGAYHLFRKTRHDILSQIGVNKTKTHHSQRCTRQSNMTQPCSVLMHDGCVAVAILQSSRAKLLTSHSI